MRPSTCQVRFVSYQASDIRLVDRMARLPLLSERTNEQVFGVLCVGVQGHLFACRGSSGGGVAINSSVAVQVPAAQVELEKPRNTMRESGDSNRRLVAPPERTKDGHREASAVNQLVLSERRL